MKIVFLGLGSIGQKHANILQKNYKHDLYAFRSGKGESSNQLGIKELYSWDQVKEIKPEVAFITNPTYLHIETAIICAEMGCKLFIEKPIGKDLSGLQELIDIVKRKKLVTYVAYNLRFHPIIKKLKEYLNNRKILHVRIVCTSYYPLWRQDRDYLKSYSAISQYGGGVILDLSHELDYASYLLGEIKDITGNYSKRSNITVDAEDYADLLVNTKFTPVNIHINFLSQLKQRFVQIDFDQLSVYGDIQNLTIKEYREEKLSKEIKLSYNKGQEYEEQLKYFFDNIENPNMMNNLLESEKLFKKLIEYKNNG